MANPRLTQYCHLAISKEDVDLFLRSENMTVEYPFRASRQVFGKTMLDSDEPKALVIKKVVAGFFSSRAVKCYEETFIHTIIRQIIVEASELCSKRIDFDEWFAQRIPTQIILAIFGIDVSHDRYIYEYLNELVQYIDDPSNSLAQATHAKEILFDFLRRCISDEIRVNQRGLIAVIDRSLFDTEDELLSTLLMVMTAGMATTIAAFNSLIVSIYTNQIFIQSIKNDNEALRKYVGNLLLETPPLHETVRFVKIPFIYKSMEFKRNEIVKVHLAKANLEQICPVQNGIGDSHKNVSSYTFGKGKHACLGAQLALSELIVFIKEFVPYMEKFSIDINTNNYTLTGVVIKSFKNVKLYRND